eukprot:GILI01009541.1.p1 GENE.GILI01009541.1~~GILI01009541.1.p1  ORF type:complete len:235 (+),score=9.47 GILI01009541.1:43-705(+)
MEGNDPTRPTNHERNQKPPEPEIATFSPQTDPQLPTPALAPSNDPPAVVTAMAPPPKSNCFTSNRLRKRYCLAGFLLTLGVTFLTLGIIFLSFSAGDLGRRHFELPGALFVIFGASTLFGGIYTVAKPLISGKYPSSPHLATVNQPNDTTNSVVDPVSTEFTNIGDQQQHQLENLNSSRIGESASLIITGLQLPPNNGSQSPIAEGIIQRTFSSPSNFSG